MNRRFIYKAFGLMDILTLGLYVVASVKKSNVPLLSDLTSAWQLVDGYGSYLPFIVAVASVSLFLSLAISLVLFIRLSSAAFYFSIIQLPFRVCFVVPSVFFVFYLMKSLGLGIFEMMAIVLLLEVLKVGLIFYVDKKERLRHLSCSCNPLIFK